MNRSRPGDPALTDYVRERLDRLVANRPQLEGAAEAEAALRTVVRPRPTLTAAGSGVETDAADFGGEPEPRSGPVRFTRHHLVVVAIVLALGALVAGYSVTRAKAVPVTAPVVIQPDRTPVAVEPGPGPVAATTPTAPPVRVHVVGEVGHPGVHTLPQGARVVDAIEAAGGLTQSAKPGELNLAQVLADGQQIVVGSGKVASEVRGAESSAGAGGGAATGAGGKVSLNTATVAQLDSLPGVGPVTAEKILAWRTQHGRFTRVEELQEVPGIGPKTFAEIAPHVTV